MKEDGQATRNVVLVYKETILSQPLTREEAQRRLDSGLDKMYNYEVKIKEIKE